MTDRAIPISASRTLFATPVLDTYWRFACARQNAFMRRVTGAPPPWTDDPILASYRFTNAYRASDRVSQYLIRHVQYEGSGLPEELFFRTLLFKIFNRIETWRAIVDFLGGAPQWGDGGILTALGLALNKALARGDSIYSAAYIMPNPPFGADKKFANHLLLLSHMMLDSVPEKAARTKSLRELYQLLRGYPSLGDFLAFQFAIDLNYSTLTNHSEAEFVVAGPGAVSGIKKCFSGTAGLSPESVIRVMPEIADAEFSRLGLRFQTLWGRPLQLIDYQNLFCETDKYARVAHPEASGSGRTKIKQRYTPSGQPCPQWYPPKWGIVPS